MHLSPSAVGPSDWEDDCKATIWVLPVDDDQQEAVHYVSLLHTVTEDGTDIILNDNSTLYAPTVLVEIYDDDIAGVIIDEPPTKIRTAEIDDVDKSKVGDCRFYEDEYRVRLSSKPISEVSVVVQTIEVAADSGSEARLQANVGIVATNGHIHEAVIAAIGRLLES